MDDCDTPLTVAFIDFWPSCPWDGPLEMHCMFAFYTKATGRRIVAVSDWHAADVVIASVFGHVKAAVEPRRLVVYSGENTRADPRAAINVGSDIGPDAATGGNLYFRIPLWALYFCDDDDMAFSALAPLTAAEAAATAARPLLACTVVSNPTCDERNAAIAAFLSAGELASGGLYSNNVGGRVHDKVAFGRSARFMLSFENGSHPGYTTEKAMQARESGCVPIYWGGPTPDLTPAAVIHATDFASPEALLAHVRALSPAAIAAALREPLVPPATEQAVRQAVRAWCDAMFAVRSSAPAKPADATVYACPFPKQRVGQPYDGGKVIVRVPGVCYDALLAGGIGNDASFEEALLEVHPHLQCTAFDGTITDSPSAHPRFSLVRKNVGGVDTDAVSSLRDLLSAHYRAFVKMDIEGAEYAWLTALTDAHLSAMAQIVIELHSPFSTPGAGAVLRRLNRTHVLLHLHPNNCCGSEVVDGVLVPSTFEATYVLRTLLPFGPPRLALSVDPIPSAIDMPNIDLRPDICLTGPPFVHAA